MFSPFGFMGTQVGSYISGSGGTVYDYSGYRTHVFDNPGTDTFTISNELSGSVDILLIGGGGAGCGSVGVSCTTPGPFGKEGGGGGAGGAVYWTGSLLTTGTYPVQIGSGGFLTQSMVSPRVIAAESSSFNGLTALGGGWALYNYFGQDYSVSVSGANGGCGGGLGPGSNASATNTTASQASLLGDSGTYGLGNINGLRSNLTICTFPAYGEFYQGAGGGGIQGNGVTINGGDGLVLDWTGTSLEYGKGGDSVTTYVQAVRGSGGDSSNSSHTGSLGGDGILMIRYQYP